MESVSRALVCGAGGFIGGHLVKLLKQEGHWVRGVDIKEHEFAVSAADDFLLLCGLKRDHDVLLCVFFGVETWWK